MDFATDRTTGQLYRIGDLDMTPINLFGGIPDEDLHDQATGSTRSLLKTPQAMSTPITEVPRSVPTELIMKDSIPLPTSRIPTTSQKEKKLMSDTDVTDDVPATVPIFNLNRAKYKQLLQFPVWKRARALLMMMNMKEPFKDWRK